MQGLEEEPAYRESDIKSEKDREFFRGYKFAFDEVCTILDNMEYEGEIAKNLNNDIQLNMSGSLCMVLFSILDEQDCED